VISAARLICLLVHAASVIPAAAGVTGAFGVRSLTNAYQIFRRPR
jgi:hypothetical protein